MKSVDKQFELNRYSGLVQRLRTYYKDKDVSFEAIGLYIQVRELRYLLRNVCTGKHHLELCHIEFKHDTLDVLRFFDMYTLQENYVIEDKDMFEDMYNFWNSYK